MKARCEIYKCMLCDKLMYGPRVIDRNPPISGFGRGMSHACDGDILGRIGVGRFVGFSEFSEPQPDDGVWMADAKAS